MASVDLNSDLGEGFGPWLMGNDAAMLGVVTSANIACGFHAGDPAGILKVLKEAATRGVSIGAHVGYRDLVGFGRRNMDPSSDELFADTIYQIGALQRLASVAGTKVQYVKPHGALYNTIASDKRQAADVISAIKAIDPTLTLMALAGAPVVAQARDAGLSVVCEAFADRAYNSDGTLVSRRIPGSVIHDPQVVGDRMERMVTEKRISSIDGSDILLEADSICIHGDTPAAVAMASMLRDLLVSRGIDLEPFTARREIPRG